MIECSDCWMRRISIVCLEEGANRRTIAQLLSEPIADRYVCSRRRVIVDIVCVVILYGGFVGKGDIVELAGVLEMDCE